MRAYIRPEYKIGKKSYIYTEIGTDLYHTVKMSDRSYKGFINAFKGDDSWEFGQAFHIMAGFKYGF